MLGATLGFFGRHGPAVLAAGVFAGLAVPPVATLLRPLLVPSIFLVFTLTLVRTDWRAIVTYGRRPALLVGAAIWMLLLSPLIMAGMSAPLALPPAIFLSLVVFAASPPIITAPALALMLRLDAPYAVAVSLVSAFAMPITLPPLMLWLLGVDLNIGIADLTLRLAVLVVVSFLGAWLFKRVAGPARLARWAEPLDGGIVITMVIYAIAIMDGIAAEILARPGFMMLLIVVAFAANFVFQALGAAAFAWGGRRVALSTGLMSGNRNMGLLLAALADRAEIEFVMFVAVAQFPIFLFPAMQRPLYDLLLGRARPP